MLVLVVDDDPFVLELLARVIGRVHTVITAATTDEAIAVLGEHEIDAVVSDFTLGDPERDGFWLLRRTVDLRPQLGACS